MWLPVFGTSDATPDPDGLLAHLRSLNLPVTGHFRGDDLGWFACELRLPGGGTPVYLERYSTAADGLRDDLNTWAAWLETQDHDPNHLSLMQRVIATRQMVTV